MLSMAYISTIKYIHSAVVRKFVQQGKKSVYFHQGMNAEEIRRIFLCYHHSLFSVEELTWIPSSVERRFSMIR